jgi:hypothetical protein
MTPSVHPTSVFPEAKTPLSFSNSLQMNDLIPIGIKDFLSKNSYAIQLLPTIYERFRANQIDPNNFEFYKIPDGRLAFRLGVKQGDSSSNLNCFFVESNSGFNEVPENQFLGLFPRKVEISNHNSEGIRNFIEVVEGKHPNINPKDMSGYPVYQDTTEIKPVEEFNGRFKHPDRNITYYIKVMEDKNVVDPNTPQSIAREAWIGEELPQNNREINWRRVKLSDDVPSRNSITIVLGQNTNQNEPLSFIPRNLQEGDNVSVKVHWRDLRRPYNRIKQIIVFNKGADYTTWFNYEMFPNGTTLPGEPTGLPLSRAILKNNLHSIRAGYEKVSEIFTKNAARSVVDIPVPTFENSDFYLSTGSIPKDLIQIGKNLKFARGVHAGVGVLGAIGLGIQAYRFGKAVMEGNYGEAQKIAFVETAVPAAALIPATVAIPTSTFGNSAMTLSRVTANVAAETSKRAVLGAVGAGLATGVVVGVIVNAENAVAEKLWADSFSGLSEMLTRRHFGTSVAEIAKNLPADLIRYDEKSGDRFSNANFQKASKINTYLKGSFLKAGQTSGEWKQYLSTTAKAPGWDTVISAFNNRPSNGYKDPKMELWVASQMLDLSQRFIRQEVQKLNR